jgi:heavy metal sensor kinase
MMNTRSIRFRLISWYAGLLAVLFIIIGVSGYIGLRYYLKQISKETLTKRARLVAGTLLADLEFGEPYFIDDIHKHHAPEINDRFLRVTRDDGTILYTSGPPKDGSFDPSILPPLQQRVSQPYLREESLGVKGGLLIYTLPITVSGERIYLIEAGMSVREIEQPLNGLLITFIICLPLIVAITIVGGYLLIRRVLIPVDELTQGAERITLSNLSERLPIAKTGDELERLSIALNNMIMRLEETFQHISRFSADASHELRTPLTILHCDLEATIQKPQLTPEIRELIGSALGETERLAKIIDGLLAISRLDAGEARIEKAQLDLGRLVGATVEQMRLLADDKLIALSCITDKEVYVEGDSVRLKQVVVNLLDNAIKYTPEGGSIRVIVFIEKGMGVLEVEDTGIGVPIEAIPHLFERFYRADKARSRQMGGAGLGLSIVKSICAAHGGQVTVRSTEGHGSCFRVEIPCENRITRVLEQDNSPEELSDLPEMARYK